MKKKAIFITLLIAILVSSIIVLCACDIETYEDYDRFVTIGIYELSSGTDARLMYDKETKVMYLFVKEGYGGGLTVLLNPDGTPMLYEEGNE